MGVAGRPVSGRVWKSSTKPTRNLKLEGTPVLGSSWDKKQKERQRLKLAREKELEMKADIAAKRQVRSASTARGPTRARTRSRRSPPRVCVEPRARSQAEREEREEREKRRQQNELKGTTYSEVSVCESARARARARGGAFPLGGAARAIAR